MVGVAMPGGVSETSLSTQGGSTTASGAVVTQDILRSRLGTAERPAHPMKLPRGKCFSLTDMFTH
jgi:hypothetical protein